MRVVRRRIESIELEGRSPRIDDIVPRSRRDKNGVILADRPLKIQPLSARSHHDDPLPLFQAEELVVIRMYL